MSADWVDLSGKAAVVTGASSGLGLEVARGLASMGAEVVLAVRSLERGQTAASAIRSTNPGARLEVRQLDLADLASIHTFAQLLKTDRLHLLVNNAGVASSSLERTKDGFELVFGTNHLGHFALTGLLLPKLAAPARVVTVSSMAHRSGRIDFDNLDASKSYEPSRAYAEAKLANVLFAYELQRRLSLSGRDQFSVACDPGWAATKMTVGSADQNQRLQDRFLQALTRRFAPTAAQGARFILFAATSPGLRGGEYIGPGGGFGVGGSPVPVRSAASSYDRGLAGRLWSVSEGLTGVRFDLPVGQLEGVAEGGGN